MVVVTGMEIQATNTLPLDWSGDGLAIGFEDNVELSGQLAELDSKLSSAFTDLIADAEFKGKAGSSAVTRVGSNSPVRKVMVIGLGKPEPLKLDSLRRAAAVTARTAKKEKCKTLGIHFPVWNDDPASTAQAIAEGIELALHQDKRFKSEPEDNPSNGMERVELLGLGEQTQAIQRAHQVCTGVILARELVAAPANIVTPITLAETAAAIAKRMASTWRFWRKKTVKSWEWALFSGLPKPQTYP